jgi:hypothetical protein
MTGCFAVTVRALCILFGLWCWRNFGKGLKERMFSGDKAGSGGNAAQRGVGADPVLAAHSNPYANSGPALAHDEEDIYSSGVGGGGGGGVTVVHEQPSGNQGVLRTYLQPLL